MKKVLFLLSVGFFLVLISNVRAECVTPTDTIHWLNNNNNKTWICLGIYYIKQPMVIQDSYDITIDCNGATFVGDNSYIIGILIRNSKHVAIYNCTLINYTQPIGLGNSDNNHIENNTLINFNYGIGLGRSNNNVIVNNFIKNEKETFTDGIEVSSSDFNVITGNSLINSYIDLRQNCAIYPPDTQVFCDGIPTHNYIYNNILDKGWITSKPNNFYCVNSIGNTYLDGATGPTCPEDLEPRVSALESWKTTIDSWKSSIDSVITNIQNDLIKLWIDVTDHETRIKTLEQVTTSSSTTTTSPTTTTIPPNIEERLSIIEKMICQIKYIDGFCPPKCPRPYSCSNTCEDDTIPSVCYDRTIHSEYYCSSDKVCCESVRVTCLQNIELQDAYCQNNKIIYSIKNIGNADVNSLTFYVDSIRKSATCNPTLPIKPNQTTTCTHSATLGTHQVRVVGPSNAVGGTVNC